MQQSSKRKKEQEMGPLPGLRVIACWWRKSYLVGAILLLVWRSYQHGDRLDVATGIHVAEQLEQEKMKCWNWKTTVEDEIYNDSSVTACYGG